MCRVSVLPNTEAHRVPESFPNITHTVKPFTRQASLPVFVPLSQWSSLAHIKSLSAFHCWHRESSGLLLTHMLVLNTCDSQRHTHTHFEEHTSSTNGVDIDEWASLQICKQLSAQPTPSETNELQYPQITLCVCIVNRVGLHTLQWNIQVSIWCADGKAEIELTELIRWPTECERLWSVLAEREIRWLDGGN